MDKSGLNFNQELANTLELGIWQIFDRVFTTQNDWTNWIILSWGNDSCNESQTGAVTICN